MTSLSEKMYFNSPKSVQNFLVSIKGYQLARKRYSGRTYREIKEKLAASRKLEKEIVYQNQFSLLKEIISYAYDYIPYYQKLFRENNFTLKDLQKIEDIENIPFLEKETFRSRSQQFLPNNIRLLKYFTQTTSGSTGTPLKIEVDQYTYQLANALLIEHEEMHGISFGAPRATFAGRLVQPITDQKPPFWRYNRAENQLIFSAFHLSKITSPAYVNKLNQFSPHEIIGYPSVIYELAQQIRDNDLHCSFRLKAIVTNSEILFGWQRKLIEQIFGCPIFDYYGTAEYVIFAGQCIYGNYHINPLLGIVEVVDENGRPIKNSLGEVVCTTLTNRAMPLLRYKVGDTAIMNEQVCECGCPYVSLTSIEGRIADSIIASDGRKVSHLSYVFKGIIDIKEAQIVQHDLNYFQIKIVKAENYAMAQELVIKQNLMDKVGLQANITIDYVSSIERTSRGKFKGVLNIMNKQ